MDKSLNYLIFCIEEYKQYKHITGKEVASLFKKYDVFNYILDRSDALHTTGTKYMLADIDSYIEEKRAKSNTV